MPCELRILPPLQLKYNAFIFYFCPPLEMQFKTLYIVILNGTIQARFFKKKTFGNSFYKMHTLQKYWKLNLFNIKHFSHVLTCSTRHTIQKQVRVSCSSADIMMQLSPDSLCVGELIFFRELIKDALCILYKIWSLPLEKPQAGQS
jgi:hypothetical protein